MSEVKPMLLEEIDFSPDVFDKYANWIFQEKQNGFRAVAHFRNGKITSIRNRRNSPCLNLFPELAGLQLGDFDAIVDGEIVQFDDKGKSIFYGGINQRDKKFYPERVATHPVCFVAFDILYLRGEVVVNKPYSERYALLSGLFGEGNKHFKVAQNIANPKEYWDKVVVPENREGFVVKNPNGKYEVDTRSKNNLKLKFYKRASVLVEKLESNPKGVKIYGHFLLGNERIEAEVQWSSMGFENIKVGDEVPVEYLDIVNNRLVQPHKVKGVVIDA